MMIFRKIMDWQWYFEDVFVNISVIYENKISGKNVNIIGAS